MARLRGPRVPADPLPVHGPNLEQAEARDEVVPGPRPRSYQDAMYEALDQVHKLGLDADLAMPSPAQRDPSDVVRYVYAQGWLACESRLASPDLADLIYQAITNPASIIEVGDRGTSHQVRAVQQIVTYGVKSEIH